MKKLMKKLEDIMVAITFAEAGEYDEAARHSGGSGQQEIQGTVDPFKRPAAEKAGE